MTRKHFEAIAAILRNEGVGSHDSLTVALADLFESENPRFDRERFIKAVYGE